MPSPRSFVLVAACVGVLAVAASPALAAGSKPLPPLAHGPQDGLARALENGRVTPAHYAFERALSLFAPARVARRYGSVERPDPRAATLILRDLAVRARQLSGSERDRALALLARPTTYNPVTDPDSYTVAEETPVCGAHVCVHYVASTPDAVAPTDADANGVPDYVDQALQVFDSDVWGAEVTGMGYRAPKDDSSSTNNGHSAADPAGAKFDVYLANLGDSDLYGYCTSDDPNLGDATYTHYDMSGYCVVDNDFSEPIFAAHTPLENLEVTAAHEFFHAVQFAYDAFEDQWLMEATATWMEDEVYTSIDDNLQYLPDSPLHAPGIPLDKGAPAQPCCHVYGDWIFFRFLSESFGPSAGVEDPTVIRGIWARADGSAAGPDDYSTQAVRSVAAARGTSFAKLFADFAWANRVARSWYAEGAANAYPQSPLSARRMTLSRSAPSRSKAPTLDHQTSRYYEFRRGSTLPSRAKLRIVLDLPGTSTGAAASALVFRSGGVTPYRLHVGSDGNGAFSLPFGSAVSRVDLVLANASARYTSCWVSTSYACAGRPADDGRVYRFTAKVR